ncbi:MAG: right-handed parallel beta-helix repeat-containing protein [Phycisphaeraceae bacterium]|nr:MAG: right-handed parallel beta-helix repeat-containing protein [Phycisphaeraceae bacterium]
MHRRHLAVPALAAAALTGGLLVAGPLSPPNGPVASTYKTLADVEPRTPLSPATTPGDNDTSPSVYRITQPGSYYLTADLVAGASHGIEIASHNVTIDLNGFSIRGSSTPNRSGIYGNLHQLRNVEVRNGSIRDFARAGVDLADPDDWSSPRLGRIDRLRVSNCGNGIAPGREYTVADCVVSGGSNAVLAYGELLVERCHLLNTSTSGITSLTGSTVVRGCRIDDTGANGVRLTQGTVEDTDVSFNAESGITIFSSGMIRRCRVSNAGATAISAGPASSVEGCHVYAFSLVGIRAEQRSRVLNNHVFYSFGSDPNNVQIGIDAPQGTVHVEGNTIARADVGVSGAGGGNTVVKNVFSSCTTSVSLAGSNQVGAFITAAGTIVSTNPWANLAQ